MRGQARGFRAYRERHHFCVVTAGFIPAIYVFLVYLFGR